MAKGYWIVHVTVDDPAAYDGYRKAVVTTLAAYGGHFLVRAGARTDVEGHARPRTIVIEFPSYQAAIDCYQSDTYKAAKAIRDPISSADFVIVEGYDG